MFHFHWTLILSSILSEFDIEQGIFGDQDWVKQRIVFWVVGKRRIRYFWFATIFAIYMLFYEYFIDKYKINIHKFNDKWILGEGYFIILKPKI